MNPAPLSRPFPRDAALPGLPPSAPQLASAVEPARERGTGLRVLVIEDSAEAARTLASLLGLVGHETRIALDAEEALLAVEAFRPQAILLDLRLPGIGGLELARRLRRDERGPACLMIALTAEQDPGMRSEALRAGCDDYMAKPLNFERLRGLLARGRGAEDAAPGA